MCTYMYVQYVHLCYIMLYVHVQCVCVQVICCEGNAAFYELGMMDMPISGQCVIYIQN